MGVSSNRTVAAIETRTRQSPLVASTPKRHATMLPAYNAQSNELNTFGLQLAHCWSGRRVRCHGDYWGSGRRRVNIGQSSLVTDAVEKNFRGATKRDSGG
jgi:hypothetical protein